MEHVTWTAHNQNHVMCFAIEVNASLREAKVQASMYFVTKVHARSTVEAPKRVWWNVKKVNATSTVEHHARSNAPTVNAKLLVMARSNAK